MDKRAILFLIISSTLVFAYIMIDASFAPRRPPAREQDAEQNADDQSDDDQADDDQADDDASGDDASDGDPSNDDQSSSDADNDGQDSDQTADADSENQSAPDDDTASDDGDESNQDQPLITVREGYPHRLVTLGSMAADSPYRMLATFNSRAGTIHRIELNDRLENGRLRYRHTDVIHGYLGSLDLEPLDNRNGARITVVGHGTPAQIAECTTAGGSNGLRVGDIITHIGDAVINEPANADEALASTTPGSQISVKVLRDAEPLEFNVQLTQRPLEVIAPPFDMRDPDADLQESFIVRLGVVDRGSWSAFHTDMTKVDWDTLVLDHRVTDATTLFAEADLQSPNGETLPAKKHVEILKSESDSVLIRCDDGRQGWVANDSIEELQNTTIAFTFTLSEEQLASLDCQGPIQVVKRYRLAQTPTKEQENPLHPSYHLEFDIELRNLSDSDQTIAFQIDGPTGSPTEGWWFANKIHGRSTAIGYSAGARDVVGGSEFQPHRFFGGPEIFSNEVKKNSKKSYEPKSLFTLDREREYRHVHFLGVDSQYFNVSFLPEGVGDDQPFYCTSAFAIAIQTLEKADKKYRKLVNVTFRVTSEPIVLQPYDRETGEGRYRLTSRVFAGPKEPHLLSEYGLEDTVTYGWFALFSKPLVWLLHQFHWMVGNYGLAIIMLTVLVRCAMVPISRKAVRNAQMMQYLSPELKKIQEKYKSDFEKRGKAQRELFKQYNYNPMGGCLLVFLQLPIFIGLYRGLSVDIALRDQPLIPGLEWCSNLAAPDKLLRWDSIPIGFLFSETGWLGPYLNVLPIITIVLFLVQQKLFTPPATDEQMRMTQKMMTYMMIFIGVMFFKVPSGLCIYFITSSLWGIAERKLIPKPKLRTDLPPLPSDGDSNGSSSKPSAPEPEPVTISAAAIERREQQKQRRKKLKRR